MKILTTLPRMLLRTDAHVPKTHSGGEVVTAVMIFVFLLATITCSTQTAWSSHVVCINWNEL